MSIFDRIIDEQYPYQVKVIVNDGLLFSETRKAIEVWCRDNIYEYDIALLYSKRNAVGYKICCSNLDDWMLAKLRWI
jgi:hypothetical protein